MRSSSLISAYKRARHFRKAMLVTFFAVFIATLLYAIPWLPYGLTVEDYDQRLTVLILLVMAAAVSAFGAVYLREASMRMQQTIDTYATVQEGLGDLRRREYFYERIVYECDLAEARRGEFAVIALRLEERPTSSLTEGKLAEAIGALEPMIREQDCVAALGPHEIGVLAPRIRVVDAEAFAERLRARLEATPWDRPMKVLAGWAVYPLDARDAGPLVGVARKRMLETRAASTRSSEGAAGPDEAGSRAATA